MGGASSILGGSLGFPGGSDGTESACNVGGLGPIADSGRCPGGGHGNLLPYSCLGGSHGQRSLVGYSPWGYKESYIAERLGTHAVEADPES